MQHNSADWEGRPVDNPTPNPKRDPGLIPHRARKVKEGQNRPCDDIVSHPLETAGPRAIPASGRLCDQLAVEEPQRA